MWSNFEAVYNAEETINNEFCASGIFKVTNSETEVVKEIPHILAYVQNGRMVIAIDNIILLLENESIVESKYISFDSKINALATSNSGNLIICGLCDGTIIGLCIKGFPVFRHRINEDDIKEDKTFVAVKVFENNSFYITCTNGSVYHLNGINEENFKNLLSDDTIIQENGTITYDDTCCDDVKLVCLTKIQSTNEITANEIILTNCSIPLSIAGTKSFIKFFNDHEELKIALPDDLNGIKNIYNLDNYILALSNDGHLFKICSITKLIYGAYNLEYLIDDIIIMENNNEAIELLILTKSENSLERNMKIIEFPSFKCNFNVEVPSYTWLIKQPKSSVNLYYLVSEQVNENNLPIELEMKIISETEPQQKLIKLIHKGRLEEAEEFGKQFELSLQPIYKAKVRRCILEIRNNDTYNFVEKNFENLAATLKLIEDKEFFISIRFTEFSNRRILKTFLNKILILLGNDKIYEEHILSIKEQLLRLETLDIIDPFECNLEWHNFVYNTDLVKYYQLYFKTDTLISCLIWKRHSSAIIPHLSEENFQKLLDMLPTNIELFEIIQWLRSCIPTVQQSFPKSMLYLVDWCYNKTVLLQFSPHWPEIGLEFSTKTLEIFQDIKFIQTDLTRMHEACMEKLNKLVFALQDLSVLRKSYNLVLTLEDYQTDSIDESSFKILQHVRTDVLQDLINNFLYPIFTEKGKTPIVVLIKYIKFLVNNRYSFTTWIERCIVLIDLLHNEEDKLECALYVLQNASVPWPDTVKSIVQLRASSHPLGKEIQRLCEIRIIETIKVKYNWPTTNNNNIKLVYRIVKDNLPSMIDDIHDLTNACGEIELHANFYCCFELAKQGRVEEAVNFFRTLEEGKKKDCSDMIMEICFSIISDIKNDHITNDYIMEFFQFVSHNSSQQTQDRFITIKNIKLLFNKYGIITNDLETLSQREREQLMLVGIENISKKVYAQNNHIPNIIQYILQEVAILTTALKLEKMLGLIHIAKYFNNVHLSCALAYNIVELIDCTEDNVNFILEFGILIIYQQIIFDFEDRAAIKDPLTYPLANSLFVKCLKKKNMIELYHIFQWTNIGTLGIYDLNIVEDYYKNMQEINQNIAETLIDRNDCLNQKSGSRRSVSVFENFIDRKEITDKPPCDARSVTKCLSLAILLIVITKKEAVSIYNIFDNYLTQNIKDSLKEIEEQFYRLLYHLIKSKQHKSWYGICKCILYHQNLSNYKMPSGLISAQSKKMFRHLLSQNIESLNFDVLCAMLIKDKQPQVFLESLWDELRSEQQKNNYLLFCESYYTRVDEVDKADEAKKCRMKYFYYGELCKLDPNFKKNFDISIHQETELLTLLKSKTLDIDVLKSLSTCESDYQELLESQIIIILKNQELKFEIKTDAFGKEELIIKTTVEDILKLCQPYIDQIKNTDRLSKQLYKFFNEIHYYFYELYLCVIEILTFINRCIPHFKIYSNILTFLKYKMRSRRLGRPGPKESESWLSFQPESGVLPKISKYRLPFLPIVQKPLKHHILSDEVNIDNCESWFPLIRLHSSLGERSSSDDIIRLQDYFCMSAVKKSIQEIEFIKANNEVKAWNLKPKNNAFLQGVLRLIKNVSDNSTILLILYFVTNWSAEGADQVEAAYECYNFAINNENELMETNQETVLKIKRKYPVFKTQHLLLLYGLNEDKLLQLVDSPKELINALYHHSSILESRQIDINKIAKELAELHNLVFYQIQHSLLQKWLTFSTENDCQDIEETFYEDFNNSATPEEEFSNDNITRAYYILKSWNRDKAINFVLSNIYSDLENEEVIQSDQPLHMLEVFAKLIDNSDSVSEYLTVVDQQAYITCKCMYYLKRLGYNFTINKFKDYDKLELLTSLWENHQEKPLAMKIISNICIGFNLHDPRVWNGVLRQMINLNMYEELDALVEHLSCKPELLHIEGLELSWQYVLRQPFLNASPLKSIEEEDQLTKTLFRIQTCPLVSKLNLLDIAEDCIRIKRPYLAAIFLALCNERQRQSIISLIEPHVNKKLKSDIINLQESGILNVIINRVLKQLEL